MPTVRKDKQGYNSIGIKIIIMKNKGRLINPLWVRI